MTDLSTRIADTPKEGTMDEIIERMALAIQQSFDELPLSLNEARGLAHAAYAVVPQWQPNAEALHQWLSDAMHDSRVNGEGQICLNWLDIEPLERILAVLQAASEPPALGIGEE